MAPWPTGARPALATGVAALERDRRVGGTHTACLLCASPCRAHTVRTAAVATASVAGGGVGGAAASGAHSAERVSRREGVAHLLGQQACVEQPQLRRSGLLWGAVRSEPVGVGSERDQSKIRANPRGACPPSERSNRPPPCPPPASHRLSLGA